MKKKILAIVVVLALSVVSLSALTNTPLAINATGGPVTLNATFVDSSGAPVTTAGYTFLWNFSDNGVILTANGPLANSGTLQVTPTGNGGTVTVTVTANKSGSNQTFTGTNTINVTGAINGIVITLGS